MTIELLEKISELKQLINEDERIKQLNHLNQLLEKDEEVIKLSYQKDLKASDYSYALNHYSQDDEQIKKYQKALFEAKYALETHPLVREYLSAYQKVRLLNEQINRILFKDFDLKACKKE